MTRHMIVENYLGERYAGVVYGVGEASIHKRGQTVILGIKVTDGISKFRVVPDVVKFVFVENTAHWKGKICPICGCLVEAETCEYCALTRVELANSKEAP